MNGDDSMTRPENKDWAVKELNPTLADDIVRLEAERQKFLNEEWERIHANDPNYWDTMAHDYESYEDKILEKSA